MEPWPDPWPSIVSAELPADSPHEEVTEEWPAVTGLSGADGDTDPFGFPTADPADAHSAASFDADPGWEELSNAAPSAYVGADPGWAVPHDAADAALGDGDPGWAGSPHAEESAFAGADAEWADADRGWAVPHDADSGWVASPDAEESAFVGVDAGWADAGQSAYVGADPGWVVPHDAADTSLVDADPGWAASPHAEGAAFAGADAGWADAGQEVYVGADPGWVVPHDAAEPAYVDPGWSGPHDAAVTAVADANPGLSASRGARPPGTGPSRGRLRAPGRLIGFSLLIVALFGVAAIVTAGLIASPGAGADAAGPSGASSPPGRDAGAVAATLTAPVAGLGNAVFDLADSATSVRLHAAELGGDLYRISAPAGSGLLPRVVRSGPEVRLFLSHSAHPGSGVVDVAVNSTVGWTLHLNAGVRQTVLDMAAGKVDGIELAGGASRVELILPRPKGLVQVRMTGGVNQFLVRLAKLTPVRVQADSGAGQVTLGGSIHRGIAPGQSFTAYGWGDGTAGIDLQAVAGMGGLTVTDR